MAQGNYYEIIKAPSIGIHCKVGDIFEPMENGILINGEPTNYGFCFEGTTMVTRTKPRDYTLNFKKGEYYRVKERNNGWEYIFKSLGGLSFSARLAPAKNEFSVNNGLHVVSMDYDWEVSFATQDQIEWLTACEEVGYYATPPLELEKPVAIKDLKDRLEDIAKTLYPIGTKYKGLDALGDLADWARETKVVREPTANNQATTVEAGLAFIYAANKWAEIIPQDTYEWIPEVGDWVTVLSSVISGTDGAKLIGKPIKITQPVTKKGHYGWYITGYKEQYPHLFPLAEGGIYLRDLVPTISRKEDPIPDFLPDEYAVIVKSGSGVHPDDVGKPIIKLSYKPFACPNNYYDSYCRKATGVTYITAEGREYINCDSSSVKLISIEEFHSLTSLKNQSNGRPNNTVQLRTTAPKIRQGEGFSESRIQSRKGKIELAEFDPLNQGSLSYGKTKGRRS